MQTLLREPLVHFLLLGAALFLVSGLVSRRADGDAETIVVTRGQVQHLAAMFARTWQRPPSQQELDGLIREHIREEVYYREALALGVHKDDVIVRRRMRQKLEFIAEDIAAQTEPTDEDLRAYLQEHAQVFRLDQRMTFSHVYLNPDRRGTNLARDAEHLLATLNRAGVKADLAELGDPFLLGQTFDAVSTTEVAASFGEKFVVSLDTLPVGRWHGPVESGYGVHLVLVSGHTEGRMPQLDAVREVVRREWANARRLEVNKEFYERLLKRYTVSVEQPQPKAAEAGSPARLGRL
jgi:parvulin-like peptidyl-prolyl cis-trans isomerase-like protein